MSKVQRALISVSDKNGIVDFAKELHGLGVEILSTGGTARALKEAGIDVKDVETNVERPFTQEVPLKAFLNEGEDK